MEEIRRLMRGVESKVSERDSVITQLTTKNKKLQEEIYVLKSSIQVLEEEVSTYKKRMKQLNEALKGVAEDVKET